MMTEIKKKEGPIVKIEASWHEKLRDEFAKPYFSELSSFLEKEKKGGQHIYPQGSHIFNAFDSTPFQKVKVVIIGQDPYHGQGQAHGLCFSVQKGVPIPPSLKNIYKELQSDLGVQPPAHGCLQTWADKGVLLLNAILTVRAESPASHHKQGWEIFTDEVIAQLNAHRENLVFILWGKYAEQKGEFIDRKKHLVLTAAHPSPFSASRFLGCKHFSQTNSYLKSKGKKEIDWQIN